MTEEKIQRINELARKSRSEGLTEDEKKEQQKLRDEYRAAVRRSLIGNLENTYIETPDGKKTKVKRVK